jgi:hypothetical protein
MGEQFNMHSNPPAFTSFNPPPACVTISAGERPNFPLRISLSKRMNHELPLNAHMHQGIITQNHSRIIDPIIEGHYDGDGDIDKETTFAISPKFGSSFMRDH